MPAIFDHLYYLCYQWRSRHSRRPAVAVGRAGGLRGEGRPEDPGLGRDRGRRPEECIRQCAEVLFTA